MNIRGIFGFSNWDPYGGRTPEAFMTRQRLKRRLWLAIVLTTLVLAVLRLLPG